MAYFFLLEETEKIQWPCILSDVQIRVVEGDNNELSYTYHV